MNAIERVAVIGSGVMGGGIAAHLANAGASVLLLDVASKDGPDRSAVARAAVARLAKSNPPAFMHRRAAGRIDAGNLEDDLSRAGEADWIVEAVVERLDVKRDLYARLDAVRKPGAIVSSNTSTIPLARLTEGASVALQRDFAITHFFNPPRYMRLLEIVRGPATRPELVEQLRDFADRRLGKGVVECKDTPGFIANRIGVFWLQCALIEAIAAGLGVEQADAALGPAAGIPKTGVFGLLDLIGLDLMPHVAGSMDALLPPGDALRRYMEVPEVLRRMVAGGYTGRKGKGGFYRLRREGGERIKESIDLATGEYHRSERARPACVEAAKTGGPRALVEHDSEEGRYAWRVLSSVLAYSASLVPEISDDVAGVDAAMRLGYNWRAGPFELADRLGPGRLADRLRAEGRPVPSLLEAARGGGFYREAGGRIEQIRAAGTDPAGGYVPIVPPPGIVRLADVKRGRERVIGNDSASLWDAGRDVACLEFHSRMNTLDQAVLELIGQALDTVPDRFAGLVIHNDGENFSAGVNLGEALFAIGAGAWDRLAAVAELGQGTFKAMKYAPFPVVGAPAGMALGGGLRGPAALRRDRRPRGDLRRARGGRRRPGPGLGRMQGAARAVLARGAGRADAAGQPRVRDGEPREGLAVRARGPGPRHPPARGRHRHEPGPCPRRGHRQGPRALHRLCAPRAAGVQPARPLREGGAGARGGGVRQDRQGDRARRGGRRCPRAGVDRGGRRPDRRGRGGGPARAGTRGGALPGAHGRDPGAYRAHARYREAVAQLSAGLGAVRG